MSRSTLAFLLKTLVSLGILSFLLYRMDMAQLLRVLSSVRLSYVVVALAGYVLGQILCSIRWSLLARPLGFKNPVRDFAVFYFIGMFFNLFAPSTVGGDVGRVFYLARGGNKTAGQAVKESTISALISVLADRIIGFAVLAWIGAAALALFPAYPIPSIVRYLTYGLALAFLGGWMLLPLIGWFLERKEIFGGRNLRTQLDNYWKDRRIVVATIVLSLVAHTIQIWMQILLGRAVNIEIPWSYSFIIYPLIGTFSALPVSLNGIGLREGGYLFLLRLIDVSSEKAIAFSLLWFLIVALDSLIGGIVFIVRKSPRPSAIASDIIKDRSG